MAYKIDHVIPMLKGGNQFVGIEMNLTESDASLLKGLKIPQAEVSGFEFNSVAGSNDRFELIPDRRPDSAISDSAIEYFCIDELIDKLVSYIISLGNDEITADRTISIIN